MRSTLGLGLAMTLAAAVPAERLSAQVTAVADVAAAQYTREELENLLAPVALYPDPILAQVLVAASYPEQVEEAARHVERYGQARLDDQPWDLSVRAVAHYAPVLNLMADRPDWTTALGQAYADQPGDVMDAVQSLRGMARAHGNLVTTAEQEVVVRDRHIHILPARPQVVYVPVYDPLVVYHRPIVHLGVYRGGWSFGMAFPIGGWLTYDVDWGHRYVYYHGWDRHRWRHSWYHRSRPYVVVNNYYIQRRPTIVVVNRTVVHRRVNWGGFDRYNYVHRQVTWERRRKYDDDGYRRVASGPSWDRDRGGDRGGDRGDDRFDRRQDRRDDRFDRQQDRRDDRADRGNAPGNSGGARPGNGNGARNPSWDRGGRRNDLAPTERGNGGRGNAVSTPARTRVAASTPATSARRTDAGRYQPRGNASADKSARVSSAAPRPDRGMVDRVRAQSRPAAAAPRSTPRAAPRSAPQVQRSAPRAASPVRSAPRAAPQVQRGGGRAPSVKSAPARSSGGGGSARASKGSGGGRKGN